MQMLACLAALWLGGVAQAATPTEPPMTLEQAVAKVQDETGGKILSADPRQLGRRVEYRIKVLTPDGHVKVMVVSSESGKNPASTQSTKNLPAKSAGRKEKR